MPCGIQSWDDLFNILFDLILFDLILIDLILFDLSLFNLSLFKLILLEPPTFFLFDRFFGAGFPG